MNDLDYFAVKNNANYVHKSNKIAFTFNTRIDAQNFIADIENKFSEERYDVKPEYEYNGRYVVEVEKHTAEIL